MPPTGSTPLWLLILVLTGLGCVREPDPYTEPAASLHSRLDRAVDASCKGQSVFSPDDQGWYWTCRLNDVVAAPGSDTVKARAASIRTITYPSRVEDSLKLSFELTFRFDGTEWVCDDDASTGQELWGYGLAPRPAASGCSAFQSMCLCRGWRRGVAGEARE